MFFLLLMDYVWVSRWLPLVQSDSQLSDQKSSDSLSPRRCSRTYRLETLIRDTPFGDTAFRDTSFGDLLFRDTSFKDTAFGDTEVCLVEFDRDDVQRNGGTR